METKDDQAAVALVQKAIGVLQSVFNKSTGFLKLLLRWVESLCFWLVAGDAKNLKAKDNF